jgi:hypothetical protein
MTFGVSLLMEPTAGFRNQSIQPGLKTPNTTHINMANGKAGLNYRPTTLFGWMFHLRLGRMVVSSLQGKVSKQNWVSIKRKPLEMVDHTEATLMSLASSTHLDSKVVTKCKSPHTLKHHKKSMDWQKLVIVSLPDFVAVWITSRITLKQCVCDLPISNWDWGATDVWHSNWQTIRNVG